MNTGSRVGRRRRLRLGSGVVLLAFGICFLAPSPAYAYIDPGYGALLWQALLAGAFGALWVARSLLGRAFGWIRCPFTKRKPDVKSTAAPLQQKLNPEAEGR